jgi:hypothetical protein
MPTHVNAISFDSEKAWSSIYLSILSGGIGSLNLNMQQIRPLHSNRAGICKRLWSPGIDSEKSIPPVYVAWQADTTNRVSYRPARLRIDTWSP